MADRYLNRDRGSLLKGLVDVFCVVDVGAAGAVTLQQWNYPTFGAGPNVRTYTDAPTTGGGTAWPNRFAQGEAGVFSVARTAAGLWTITLQDSYDRLVGLRMFSTLAGGLSAVVAIHENSTITSMAATGGSVIGVALESATATALDPANGETVSIHLVLQNASEP